MKLLSYLLFFLGILIGVCAVVGGIYVCIYQGWFLGIVGAVEACKVTPINSATLAWGIIRVFLGSAAGGATCWIGWGLAALTLAAASSCSTKASRNAARERDRRAQLTAVRRLQTHADAVLDDLRNRR